MVDTARLARELAGLADIWVVYRAQDCWQLTEALPPGLDVYGGAVRLWWPIPDAGSIQPRKHPHFPVFSAEDGRRVVGEIAASLASTAPLPEPGADTLGVVTRVADVGAEITLASGHHAFVSNHHLVAHGEVYRAHEAVQVGQQVRVRVAEAQPEGKDRVRVSMKPFAPDPWERLAELYRQGDVLEGVVVGLKHYGAFVELLPGASGLLPNGRIANEHVLHAEDYLALDDRVYVRVVAWDPGNQRAELSLLGVGPDDEPQPVASLYPSGPPWLWQDDHATVAEVQDLAGPDDAEAVEFVEEPLSSDVPQEPLSEDLEAQTPEGQPGCGQVDGVEAPPEPSSVSADAGEGGDVTVGGPGDVSVDLRRLEAAIEAGERLDDELENLQLAGQRRVAQLRAEARRVTDELEAKVSAAELRVMRLAAEHADDILESTQHAVRQSTQRISQLEQQLQTAEQDREQLIQRLSSTADKLQRASLARDQAFQTAKTATAEARELRSHLRHVDGEDEERRFLRELEFTWAQVNVNREDRERHPLRPLALGPRFLESLQATEGVSRERVLEVCTHIASDRAAQLNGLELHQLRTSEAGGAPTRIRQDGATAWRVSLQVKTPSARRVHFWQLPNGGIEFSKIGVHDDYTID